MDSKGFRKNRATHCRSDKQNPPLLNSLKCHCQNINKAASNTCGPSNTTRSPKNINTHLKPDTTSNTFQQQVNHLTAHNTVSSLETNLVTDTMIDGETSFHTTL